MNNSENLEYVVLMASRVIPNSVISTGVMTVRQFCKEYVRITNSKRRPIEFSTIVTNILVSNNIKPSVKINGNPYYSKYNFKTILEENPMVATNYVHKEDNEK